MKVNQLLTVGATLREGQGSFSRPSFVRMNRRTSKAVGKKYWLKLENGTTKEELHESLVKLTGGNPLPDVSSRQMYELAKAAQEAGLVTVRTSHWKAAAHF